MALIKCKECGKEISSQTDKCPHCGANPKLKSETLATLAGIVIVGLIAVLFFSGSDKKAAPVAEAPAPVAQADPVQQDPDYAKSLAAALEAIKQEKKVKSAAWNTEKPPYLLAGVIDDGTRQNGYAQYLCHHLSDHHLYHGTVRVMDVAAAADRDKWIELGSAKCEESGEVTQVDFPKK